MTFVLPPARFGRRWAHELCTADPELAPNGTSFAARTPVPVEARAVRIMRRVG